MLNQDYKEMLLLLKKGNVEFLLIGAYALAAHGFPRSTGDIDIFVNANPENAKLVVEALHQFGAPGQHISKTDFSKPGDILQIGVAPCRIDIITSIDGLTFKEASEGKLMIDMGGIEVPTISAKNLLKNKIATGRSKDKLDADNLKSL